MDPTLNVIMVTNGILNVKSPRSFLPTPASMMFVVVLSRSHILERDYYDNFDFKHRSVRMCCGLELVNVEPMLWSLRQWDERVEWTRDHRVSVLRSQGSVRPACLECDTRFNQSEIAC